MTLQNVVYPPSQDNPEKCVIVEHVTELLDRQDAPYIAQMLQSSHVALPQTSSLKLEMMCTASCILNSLLCLKRTKATPTALAEHSDEEELEDD